MLDSTKMFLTPEMLHFCPTPADADHAFSDGYSIKKNCEWLSAIELTKNLWCTDWPWSRTKAGLPNIFDEKHSTTITDRRHNLIESGIKTVRNLLTYALVFGLGVAATFFYLHHTSSRGSHWGVHHFVNIPSSNHANHNGGKHEHYEINMPGLQGKDTTEQEVSDLKEIFRSHEGISRSVTNV